MECWMNETFHDHQVASYMYLVHLLVQYYSQDLCI